MELPLKLEVVEEDRFRKIVGVLSYFKELPFSKLSMQEIAVYSELLYLWYLKYPHIPVDDRNELVFSKRNKEELCIKVEITMDRFYNIVLNLKKVGLMSGKDTLNKTYLAFFDLKYDKISFIIKNSSDVKR